LAPYNHTACLRKEPKGVVTAMQMDLRKKAVWLYGANHGSI